MPDLELGLGGGAYINVPTKVARTLIRLTKLLGIRWFDTAFSYGMGRGERIVGPSLNKGENLITKWGLSSDWPSDSDPASRWTSDEFTYTSVREAVENSRARLRTRGDLYFLLHCGKDGLVDNHINLLKTARQEGRVSGIGYSINQGTEVFSDNGWVDLIETPLDGLTHLKSFTGVIAIHGVFRQKTTDLELQRHLATLSSARVILIAGSWKPWRLIGNASQVARVKKALIKGGQ